jgi:hypothetical protein
MESYDTIFKRIANLGPHDLLWPIDLAELALIAVV